MTPTPTPHAPLESEVPTGLGGRADLGLASGLLGFGAGYMRACVFGVLPYAYAPLGRRMGGVGASIKASSLVMLDFA